jgi:hypothetical protein
MALEQEGRIGMLFAWVVAASLICFAPYRGDGIKTALSPCIADVITGGQDCVGLQLGGPLLLELLHYLAEGRYAQALDAAGACSQLG